jgi:hypothetical protein
MYMFHLSFSNICPVVTKIKKCWHVLAKIANMKFHKKKIPVRLASIHAYCPIYIFFFVVGECVTTSDIYNCNVLLPNLKNIVCVCVCVCEVNYLKTKISLNYV